MNELLVNDLISVDQAIAILDSVPIQQRVVRLPLLDASGLLLAEDIFADRDYPPFDKAVMDGFAFRAGSVTHFTITETVAAGQVAQRSIGVGEAIAIMTGAPVPPGADTVVPIEWTTRQGNLVTINRPVKTGNAIASKGSDTTAGRLLLSRGTRLGPTQIAVAANVGKAVVQVHPAPTVALLATGDELVDIDAIPTGSQIRNSNGPMMVSLLQHLGCVVHDLGIVRDEPDQMREAMKTGLQSDALFITGGMSMGERDLVPGLLRGLGLQLKISKLRIKPGKPFVFAVGSDSRLAFGLPGNPVSAFVCTVRLASRVLNRLAGGANPSLVVEAPLSEMLSANGPREFYIPAQLTSDAVSPLYPNGSADLFTLALANAMIIRPESAPVAHKGERVQLIRFL